MNDDTIFLQKNYRDLDSNLCKYGCYFLSLCYASQMMNLSPSVFLNKKEDILFISKFAKDNKWIDSDFTVLDVSSIMKYLTGRSFSLMQNAKFGLYGKSHIIPINYPIDHVGAIEIACYRAIEDVSNTHFSLIDRKGNCIFNTLGSYWLTDQQGRFFASDKRVLIPS